MFRGDIFGGGFSGNPNLVGLMDLNEQYEDSKNSLDRLRRARSILTTTYDLGQYGALTYKIIYGRTYIQGGKNNRLFVIETGEAQLAYEEMRDEKKILKGGINLMGKRPVPI